jgi:deoxyribodipyrimidine photo-lyase
MMSSSSRLVWHRRDLRIADNELYHSKQTIYSVYIFDPSDYSTRRTGISDGNGGQLHSVNHGPHFARRLIDAVHSLRRALQSIGGDLIIRTGNPLQIIPQLAQELLIDEVAFSEIPGHYEFKQSDKLKHILQYEGPHRCKVFTTCSLTLVHPDDLPTDPDIWKRLARPNEKQKKRSKGKAKNQDNGAVIAKSSNESNSNTVTIDPTRFEGMPSIMGDFRRVARTVAPVRQLYEYPNPENIAKDFTYLDAGNIPSLKELTKPLLESDVPIMGCIPKELILKLVECAKEILHNNGNIEEQSMLHLRNFVQKHAAAADRSLCDVSNNNSSMLSLPLALGTLSPRQVYHCVKEEQNKLETEQGDINWLISHMEMRDYFLFNCFRDGASAYKIHKKNLFTNQVLHESGYHYLKTKTSSYGG